MTHVQVPLATEPLLALLDARGGDEQEAGISVREGTRDPRPLFDLLVEALQAVRRADLSAVRVVERDVPYGRFESSIQRGEGRVRRTPAFHDVLRKVEGPCSIWSCVNGLQIVREVFPVLLRDFSIELNDPSKYARWYETDPFDTSWHIVADGGGLASTHNFGSMMLKLP